MKRNVLYVDKTQYVWNLVSGGTKIYFLSRPRRFGKSLLISTLEAFFLNKRELFKGLAIDKLAPDDAWQEWPVIHLDMAKVSSSEGIDEQRRALNYCVRRVAKDLGISVNEGWDAPAILDELIVYLKRLQESRSLYWWMNTTSRYWMLCILHILRKQ